MPCPGVICSVRGSGRAFELTGLVIGMRARSKYLRFVKCAGCICCNPNLRDCAQRMNAAPQQLSSPRSKCRSCADQDPANPMTYGRTYHELRFSPLAPVQYRRCEGTRRGVGCGSSRNKSEFPDSAAAGGDSLPPRRLNIPGDVGHARRFSQKNARHIWPRGSRCAARLRPARLADLYSTEVRCQ